VQWVLVDDGAGKTALLAFTMPFWVVLLAWIALRERPGRWQWVSVAIAAAVPERALAYNAVLASDLAWVLWSIVVRRLPASAAGMISLAIPLTGVLLAWAVLGERPSLLESLGVGLIALALVGATRPAKPSER